MRLLRTFALLGKPDTNFLIYRIRRFAAFEHRGHVGRCRVAHHDARGARSAADVGREHHVGKLREFGVQLRLPPENVGAPPRDTPPPPRFHHPPVGPPPPPPPCP